MALLTSRQVEKFHDEGFLVVEDIIDTREYLDPLVDEYEALLDQLANTLYAEGKIQSTYAELPFGRRLTKVYAETGKVWAQYFDFSLPFKNCAPDEPCHFGPAVFGMLRNPKVL